MAYPVMKIISSEYSASYIAGNTIPGMQLTEYKGEIISIARHRIAD